MLITHTGFLKPISFFALFINQFLNKKGVYLCLISFLLPFMGIASPYSRLNLSYLPSSDSAQKILSKARANFNELSDFSARFTYSLYTYPIQHAPLSGRIWYKNQRFYLHIGEQKIYCDGTSQWEYDTRKEVVRIFDHDPNRGIGLIFNIFLQGGEPEYLGKDTLDIKVFDMISLSKLPANIPKYNMAKIWINPLNHFPKKIMLLAPNQIEVSFTFYDSMFNQQLSEDLFLFDAKKYPNLLIIDDRTQQR